MITIQKMTKELARAYFENYQHDLALFLDETACKPYEYTVEWADAYVDRYVALGREHLAIMLDERCIGEAIFKNQNPDEQCCTLGICLQNDSVKNKGYGTKAEILLMDHAFNQMKMKTVFADALLKNTRSQHVLEKVGFVETHRDETFVYYRCERKTWKRPAETASKV